MGKNKFSHPTTHKERGQPHGRQKLGLLEKHSDYVKRAKRHHAREDEINSLKKKAFTRNPEEFYYAMIKHKQRKDGVMILNSANGSDDTGSDKKKKGPRNVRGYTRRER